MTKMTVTNVSNPQTVSVSLAELLKLAEEKGKLEALHAVEQVRILKEMCKSNTYLGREEVMMVLGVEPEPEAEEGGEA